jgi:hypothetical protein
MDVADDYPGAHVLGIDLSPIQPGLVPPNLEFQVADAEEDWDMPGRFDLVHTRYMNGFSIRSWRQFYEQAFTSMKPGGWVENQEFDLHWTSDDGSMPADGAFEKWQRLWEQGVESVGMTARCYPEVMKRQMEEAGFINVNIVPFKMPLGPWPKDKRLRQAGIYLYSSMYEGLSGLSLRVFTQMLGWSVEELEVLLALVRAEWKHKAMHIYVPMYVRTVFSTADQLTRWQIRDIRTEATSDTVDMTNHPVFLFEAASAVPTVGIQSRNRRTFPDIFVLHSETISLFRVLNRTNS